MNNILSLKGSYPFLNFDSTSDLSSSFSKRLPFKSLLIPHAHTDKGRFVIERMLYIYYLLYIENQLFLLIIEERLGGDVMW